jgi:hypothetical protein
MTKPKIVCVIGSGILAPLTLLAFSAVVAVVWVSVFGHLAVAGWLWWLLLAVLVVCFPGTLLFCRDLYRLYFNKCYEPRTEAGFTPQVRK